MSENTALNVSGVAQVKSEFLLQDHVRKLDLNYVAFRDQKRMGENDEEISDGPPKKKLKGQNKHRPREKRTPKSEKLCFKIGTEGSCPFGDSCCYSHDVNSYLEKKPPDIGEKCYLYETFGKCPYSFSCRFASEHVKDGKNVVKDELWEESKSKSICMMNSLKRDIQISLRRRTYDFKKSMDAMNKFDLICRKNFSSKNGINSNKKPESEQLACNTQPVESKNLDGTNSDEKSQLQVPTNTVEPTTVSSENAKCVNKIDDINSNKKSESEQLACNTQLVESKDLDSTNSDEKSQLQVPTNTVESTTVSSENAKCVNKIDSDIDSDLLIPESNKIDFKDKLFLAPLTTVGNLPFRRICKEFGADITCSEMAVALSLLQGQQSEWALLKRHHTEDVFGIQLCGSHPDVMTRCSQLLSETTSFDFIDLNLGCPLDAIYKKGAGCGLMNRMKKLHGIIYGVTSVIDVPLTVKMRTGIYGHENLAHNVIKKIHEWGGRVSMITLHGRSREQRYTKSADWDYINTCSTLAAPVPLFGNGDILSYEDYNLRKAETGISGTMIARGALIKPWIFQEIKEQRHIDISSSERFDILQKFTNYGLEHWGSDTEGVEKTRRFLLEWLSFLYRYIPVGLLERVPQRINERPPAYFGRNDLETLMASPSCSDWVKISEMLLGPVPESFIFLPKHKANAYK